MWNMHVVCVCDPQIIGSSKWIMKFYHPIGVYLLWFVQGRIEGGGATNQVRLSLLTLDSFSKITLLWQKCGRRFFFTKSFQDIFFIFQVLMLVSSSFQSASSVLFFLLSLLFYLPSLSLRSDPYMLVFFFL